MDKKTSIFNKIKNKFSKIDDVQELLSQWESWDGYSREAAGIKLGEIGNPVAIDKLLVRVNDWVPEVRLAAKTALIKLLITSNAKSFVYALPELKRLKRKYRDNHSSLIRHVTEFLLLEENSPEILIGLRSDSVDVARICLDLVLESGLLSPATIAGEFIGHRDIIIRLKVSSLIRELDETSQQDTLKIALMDKFMPIRREAVQYYFKLGPSSPEVSSFLFDTHASIREIAIRKLERLGEKALPAYLDGLKSTNSHVIRCSIWGVSYFNDKDFIELLMPFLNHEFASVRKSAVAAISRILQENAEDVLIRILADESPSVCKESVRLIKKLRIRLSESHLTNVVIESPQKHTVMGCISIGREINKWEELVFTLRLLGLDSLDFDQLSIVKSSLVVWDRNFNNSFTQPNEKQVKELGLLWKAYCELLNSRECLNIAFTLRSIGSIPSNAQEKAGQP